MTGIIIWSCLLFTTGIMYITNKNEIKFKKNIVMGVTLPFEARNNPQVNTILENTKKSYSNLFLIFTIINIAGFFIKDITISMICWAIVFMLILILPILLFIRTNQKLKKLKLENGWTIKTSQQVRVNVSTIIEYKKPNIATYILPIFICIGFILIQKNMWFVHTLSLIIVIISFLVSSFLYRKKSETVDNDTKLTNTLSFFRYNIWKKVWIVGAYQAMFISISVWLFTFSDIFAISMIITSSLVCASIIICLEMQTRKLQESLTLESGKDYYVDEDDYWIWGMFYYNPNDSHIMINQRVGVSSTFNLATKTGKFMSILSAGLLIFTMILVVGIALEDKSPINLQLKNTSIVCSSGSTEYEIDFDEIEEIQLLETLPNDLFRTNALGSQNLYKGSFYGSGMDNLKIIADPKTPPYIKIKTTDERYYIFGTRNSEISKEIFLSLNNLYKSK